MYNIISLLSASIVHTAKIAVSTVVTVHLTRRTYNNNCTIHLQRKDEELPRCAYTIINNTILLFKVFSYVSVPFFIYRTRCSVLYCRFYTHCAATLQAGRFNNHNAI